LAADDDKDGTPDPIVGKDTARQVTRVARLIAFTIAAVLLLATVSYFLWWDTTPSEEELKDQAGLKGKPQLLIGVQGDIPGVSLLEAGGQYTGFDIDIGYMIGADLGFRPHEVRFLVVENEDRNRMRARDGDHYLTVDLVIATYSITELRARDPNVRFSAPYLNTEQSVITLERHSPVHELTDLAGKSVCTITTATSKSPATEAGAHVIGKRKISECIPGLRSGEFDAVTSDAAVLAGFVAKEPLVFQHHDIGLETPELWGINVGPNEPLRKLVDLSLYRSRYDPQDKRWEDAYDRHLRVLERTSLPQPVAIDKQPNVDMPEVRQWPWERLVGAIAVAPTALRRRRSRQRPAG
jgi:glutamate transport system substrate-binding protein